MLGCDVPVSMRFWGGLATFCIICGPFGGLSLCFSFCKAKWH